MDKELELYDLLQDVENMRKGQAMGEDVGGGNNTSILID